MNLYTENSGSTTERYFKNGRVFGADIPSTMFTIDPSGYIRVPPYSNPSLAYPLYFSATFLADPAS